MCCPACAILKCKFAMFPVKLSEKPEKPWHSWLVRFCTARFGVALLVGSSLVACNAASPPTTQSPVAPSVSPSEAAVSPSPSPSPSPIASLDPEEQVISQQGIGVAQLGMTLGELKQKLGPEVELKVKAPYIVDFDAIAVERSGEVQYYILYLAGQTFKDSDVIQGLLTSNPKFRTAEDVGPGTTIAAAEQVYGKATLSYNTDNESREYVRFADQNSGNLSFSTGSGGNGNGGAGIYASPQGAYNETQQFKTDATIKSIWVVCLTEDCVKPANL